MVYLAKGGFWMSLNQAVIVVSAFVLSISFANLLPKEVYGNYRYLLSIVGIVTAFTLTGMNTSVMRSIAQGTEGSLKKAFIIQILWNSAIVNIICISFALFYFYNNNFLFAGSLLILGLLTPLLNAANTFSAYLVGKKEFSTLFFLNLIIQLSNIIAIISVLFITDNILILIATYFSVQTLLYLISYFYTVQTFPPNKEVDQTAIAYGFHLSLLSGLKVVAQHIDHFLTFLFLGPIAVAIYHFASAIPQQFEGLSKTLATLAFPKIVERENNEKQLYNLKIVQLLLLFLIICIFYIVLAEFIFGLFFPSYIESIIYSQIISLTIVFSGPTTYLLNVLQARANKTNLYKYNIVTALIQIVLLATLTYSFGIWGLITARIISSVFNLIYIYYLDFFAITK